MAQKLKRAVVFRHSWWISQVSYSENISTYYNAPTLYKAKAEFDQYNIIDAI